MRCVVDASAVFEYLAGSPVGDAIADILIDGVIDVHAPELIIPEVLHAIRRAARGSVAQQDFAVMVDELAQMRLTLHSSVPHVQRVWQLRGNLSAYDACYIALAESLRIPLVTGDAKITGAPGHDADVRVVGNRR